MGTYAETILLVDDEKALRTVLSLLLSRCGYTVLEAASGKQALELYAKHGIAVRLVITDIEMPGMDGAELIDELTALGCHAPVLYISGYCTQQSVCERLKATAIHFLQKPFSPAVMLRLVRELLDGGTARKPVSKVTAPLVLPRAQEN